MFSAWEACGYEVRGQHYTVLSTSANYNVTGIASWYGEPFHGRIAAVEPGHRGPLFTL